MRFSRVRSSPCPQMRCFPSSAFLEHFHSLFFLRSKGGALVAHAWDRLVLSYIFGLDHLGQWVVYEHHRSPRLMWAAITRSCIKWPAAAAASTTGLRYFGGDSMAQLAAKADSDQALKWNVNRTMTMVSFGTFCKCGFLQYPPPAPAPAPDPPPPALRRYFS
jgi:hypothetical protein